MLIRLYTTLITLLAITLALSVLTGSKKMVTEASSSVSTQESAQSRYEYKLLATNKTSTMQKELNQAADAGYRFEGVMGGATSFGGSEVVSIMSREVGVAPKGRYEYKLLATSKTSTMQKEAQAAGDAGFEYKGQTVFSSTFGGKEVAIILERDREAQIIGYEYKLLATKKTSTMEKELNEVSEGGFRFVGVTVGDTAFGGNEVVCILRKQVQRR